LQGYLAAGTLGFMPSTAQLCQVQDIFTTKRLRILNELNQKFILPPKQIKRNFGATPHKNKIKNLIKPQ
jgi:hypothetical protein